MEKKLSLNSNGIKVIAFSRLNKNILSSSQCICIHQFEQQGIPMPPNTKKVYDNILDLIFKINWQRPEVKWDKGGKFCFDKDSGEWIELNDNN